MNQSDVMETLRTRGRCSVREIMDEFGVSQTVVARKLRSLERYGYVRRTGETESRHPAILWEAVE